MPRENGSFAVCKLPKDRVYCTILASIPPGKYIVELVGDQWAREVSEDSLEDLETPEFKRGDRVLYKPDEREDFEERGYGRRYRR